ncbi:uncharacterized protein [Heliangelus exortis]|uniref:uncharacterized protein isoform X1 n=1 Tax=Heliangelus exortis TaxID=472823 RepID=UPI003A912153
MGKGVENKEQILGNMEEELLEKFCAAGPAHSENLLEAPSAPEIHQKVLPGVSKHRARALCCSSPHFSSPSPMVSPSRQRAASRRPAARRERRLQEPRPLRRLQLGLRLRLRLVDGQRHRREDEDPYDSERRGGSSGIPGKITAGMTSDRRTEFFHHLKHFGTSVKHQPDFTELKGAFLHPDPAHLPRPALGHQGVLCCHHLPHAGFGS